MGNTFSSKKSLLQANKNETRKRKADDSPERAEQANQNDSILHTPKRRRLQSTSKYIYQTLFLNGEESDVTITTQGKQWNLHKIYLSQSPYFSCMFNGPWKESDLKEIVIDTVDPEIDEKALKIAFGSLYKDFVFIKPVEVVKVIAAATMFQLESLIEQCVKMMLETLRAETVCRYYYASYKYGLNSVKEASYDWLLTNLLCEDNLCILKELSCELLCELLSSPFLYVMQVETDIYSLLKKWMFLKLNPSWSSCQRDVGTDLSKAADEFFLDKKTSLYEEPHKPSMQHQEQSHDLNTDSCDMDPENRIISAVRKGEKKKDKTQCYLETEEGSKYKCLFRCIRWQHIITDEASIKVLEKDSVVNMNWIRPLFEKQWRKMLDTETTIDIGPQVVPTLEVFDRLSMRCGRILKQDGQFCWRWVGYTFGVDLLITYSNRIFTLKRNTHSQACQGSISLKLCRHVAYRFRVASVDCNKKVKVTKSTGMEHQSFHKDEEVVIMSLDKNVDFPVYISMNLMLTTPQENENNIIQCDN